MRERVGAVLRKRAEVVTGSGEVLPIVEWIGGDGAPCEEPDAVAAVAGPASDGRWLALVLPDEEVMH